MNMYKAFKSEKYYLAFNIFPKSAKGVSKVYHTGIRIWDAQDCKNYSIVMGTFRIIFAINKLQCGTCCGSDLCVNTPVQ